MDARLRVNDDVRSSMKRDPSNKGRVNWAELRAVDPDDAYKDHRPIEMHILALLICRCRPERGTQDCAVFRCGRMPHRKIPAISPTADLPRYQRVFYDDFPDSRLRRSPFGPASLFAPHAAQCDKESATHQRGSSAVALLRHACHVRPRSEQRAGS